MEEFQIFSSPKQLYKQMLSDIADAKHTILLETYIYDNDKIGKKFRNLLVKKARQGIKVFLLIDAWGSKADKLFFNNLEKAGGKVKFFREFRYVLRIFSKNHERNHRKLLVIDGKISYIGSANITASCLNWRELSIRLEGDISERFVESFVNNWEISGKLSRRKISLLLHKGFEIIHDHPGDKIRNLEKRLVNLINSSKKEILIETPYFAPSLKIIRALSRAVKRKVNVKIILPYISDVRVADILRNIYLGRLYRNGIKIFYYKPRVLHSKLLIVDNSFFVLGSSNLDYRSFIHQYEINLLGKDNPLINALKSYFRETLRNSVCFNYKEWKSRSSLIKIFELILNKFRHYL